MAMLEAFAHDPLISWRLVVKGDKADDPAHGKEDEEEKALHHPTPAIGPNPALSWLSASALVPSTLQTQGVTSRTVAAGLNILSASYQNTCGPNQTL